jgi:energy-coupling factor transporter transmembrane protein EcfT
MPYIIIIVLLIIIILILAPWILMALLFLLLALAWFISIIWIPALIVIGAVIVISVVANIFNLQKETGKPFGWVRDLYVSALRWRARSYTALRRPKNWELAPEIPEPTTESSVCKYCAQEGAEVKGLHGKRYHRACHIANYNAGRPS